MGAKGLASMFSRLSSSTAATSERDKELPPLPAGYPTLKSKRSLSSLKMPGSKFPGLPKKILRAGPPPSLPKDGYFSTGNGGGGAAASSAETALNKMFDDIRDPSRDGDKDSIGVESTMNYLQELNVNPESCEIFVVLEIVQASSLGEITRSGYVEGWKASGVNASKGSHQSYVRSQINALRTDLSYFRRVYRHAFVAGKEPDQKALGLDNALVYWDMMFSPPGRPWVASSQNGGGSSSRTDWLALWKEFLGDKWTRSVNRDMWNQTLEFALRSMEDGTLGFWNEDGAWPSVVDDFVLWCREKGIVGSGGPAAGEERMVVDS